MRKREIVPWGLAVASLCAAYPLPAQETPTLEALIREAVERNAELAAARRSAEAAAARVPQAGALPDPVLGVSVMNLPIRDPSLGREMMTMTSVQVAERLPYPGKLRLREDAARRMAQAADLEAESTHHRIVERVKAAWYEVYFVDRALAVTEANEALVADFARLTAVRYGVGSGAQPEVLRAQVERTGLVDRLVELRERRASAVAGLNALLHRPSETPLTAAELPGAVRGAALATAGRSLTFAAVSLSGVGAEGGTGPAPGVQPVEELQRAALEHNPAVLAQRERVAAGRSVRALAGKAALPDLSLSVAYSRRADFSDFVSLSVSAPLPVFSGRKQDQLVVEETAALAGEQARLRAMVDALNAEIAELAAGMARARDQLLLLRDGILPQAKTTVASATASYRVGEVDFLTLLDAQVTLYRYEIDYHRLLADFARDAASLERATGTEILR